MSDVTPARRIAGRLCLTLFITFLVGATTQGEESLPTIEFHGIRATDPGGRVGLRNPERGFRTETLIAELPDGGVWGPASHLRGRVPPVYSDEWWTPAAKSYEPFGLTLVQAYCYLSDYGDRPIPQEKLDLLQHSFDSLRRNGLKAVLRFAYEKSNRGVDYGPTLEWILRHIEQLGPIIRDNADVIYVLQAGFVGAWGEWHNATHIKQDDHQALAAIIKKLLEVLPEDRMTQVRVPKYKRWVLSQPVFDAFEEVTQKTAHTAIPAARIGFHNDGFLARRSHGGTWPEKPHFGSPGNPEFDYMTRESAFLPVDGELFWSDQGFDGKAEAGKGVDGLNAAIHMRLHHYSSFSLAHSYSWREGENYSIDRWLATPIDREQIREAKMPISDEYFEDSFGGPIQRTRFEYIQDHLGYRLELQQVQMPQRLSVGGALTVEVALINRGFSTLHNRRPVYIVLIGQDGRVIEFAAPGADPRRWQPFVPGDETYAPLTHRVSVKTTLPDAVTPGWYKVGLWMPDAYRRLRLDPRYAVRAANRDVLWWTDQEGRYGVNLLGVMEIIE